MTSPSPARVLAFKTLLQLKKRELLPASISRKRNWQSGSCAWLQSSSTAPLRERSLLDWWLKGNWKEAGQAVCKCAYYFAFGSVPVCFFFFNPQARCCGSGSPFGKKVCAPKAAGFVNWALRAVLRKRILLLCLKRRFF